MEKEHDVVVIGAGLGGLSVATNLAKNGLFSGKYAMTRLGYLISQNISLKSTFY